MPTPVTPKSPKRAQLRRLVSKNPAISVRELKEALDLCDTRVRVIARKEGIVLAGSRSKRAAFVEVGK